jgi:hypothetical protein
MQKRPHHAPSHIRKPWKEFLTIPWTTERAEVDLELANETGRVCQQGFRYSEVNSCVGRPYPKEKFEGKSKSWSEDKPIYEMRQDGSGLPFKNILEMRAAKILNFLELGKFSNTYASWNVPYENLLKYGTEDLISRIEEATGLERKCKASPPQPDRPKRPMEPKYIQYINDHVDWEVEALIGYSKLEVPGVEG